ncbi:RNA polymerase II subunit 3 [Hypoxylon texense]
MPAVSKDGFSYVGKLLAEASGHNSHHRASVSELEADMLWGSKDDYPAHWYEAQAMHYGLDPTETEEATAYDRICRAIYDGKLSVPAHIQQLELELKEEWTKKERDAKLGKYAEPSAIKTTKRKAESEDVDATEDVGGTIVTVSTSSPTKKTKVTNESEKKTSESKSETLNAVAVTPKASSSNTTEHDYDDYSYDDSDDSDDDDDDDEDLELYDEDKKAGAFPPSDEDKAKKEVKGEFKEEAGDDDYNEEDEDMDEEADGDEDDDYDPDAELNEQFMGFDEDDYYNPFDGYSPVPCGLPFFFGSLGLLNGSYTIDPPDNRAVVGNGPFSLVLTLRGDTLWGKFDLGLFRGVLYFGERPRRASGEPVLFKWRGRHRDGRVLGGNNNEGYIQFCGQGDIRIHIEHGDEEAQFDGARPPQDTRSPISAWQMEQEWWTY